ncbi:hypothetical protein C6I21_01525 [Alkalicoccus urumqiensis]|uniref:Family 2 glycosyl transferase n=2 Tax=Alkalicoccus urumqiensis TaxID=1548213 RepID=A0A2P6MM23_ALKUR|nr:hypothetical protein C6I21_01525 [Alkalicoccus urumqiensis]
MGMAKPGTFPGDAGISREEYRRWFEQIAEMNANTIRVYTIHPPAFYEELLRFNESHEETLYIMHGVWIDEEPLEETLDAFTSEIVETFQAEMQDAVDVIHGNAELPERPGHASGSYEADISPYVTSWVIGIEWYPFMVEHMLEEYPELGDYDGTYTHTENADPIEYWLAEQLDVLFAYEADTYASMRPFSFTNWVTTDVLDQPAEPSEQEDMASVNADAIHVRGAAEETGQFASYHVYPYYPDFLNLEEDYVNYEGYDGEPSNYAGYLNDLKEAHDMPVLIAEFGVPASRGNTHSNPYGWDQGNHSEVDQGEINAHLFREIRDQEFLGGLIFTWQDEWFKRTWNTMDYDNPDRRPFWSNAQTNEQQFGLLSFDTHAVRIDGSGEWEDETILSEVDGEQLAAFHDERYLYFRYEAEGELPEEVVLYVEVRPDTDDDFRITLRPGEGVMEVIGDYDTFYYHYNEELEETEDPDAFHPIRLALNREQIRPDTGEVLPFEYEETGTLQEGIGDPDDEAYDALTDFAWSEENGLVELRIPWMMLNAKDPSQREFMGELEPAMDQSIFIEDIGLRVEQGSSLSGRYAWETWGEPPSEERLKQSYGIIQELFSE